MATFRCKRSGNCVSFINEGDIIGLRNHKGYNEVFENEEKPSTEIKVAETSKKEQVLVTVTKSLGRPKKVK